MLSTIPSQSSSLPLQVSAGGGLETLELQVNAPVTSQWKVPFAHSPLAPGTVQGLPSFFAQLGAQTPFEQLFWQQSSFVVQLSVICLQAPHSPVLAMQRSLFPPQQSVCAVQASPDFLQHLPALHWVPASQHLCSKLHASPNERHT
jgi:hypothetical protein